MLEATPRTRGVRLGPGLIAATVIAAGAWLALREPSEVVIRTVEVPTPPPRVTVVDRLQSGQTLGEVFEANGLSADEIFRLVEKIREFYSPRRLRPGTVVQFAMRPAEPPTRVTLQLDRDQTLHLFPDETDSDVWDARLDSVPVVRDTVVLAGRIGSNVYDAHLTGDLDRLADGQADQLIFRLTQIFAWQLDFFRDIRRDDAYRMAVEREVRPDGTLRSAAVLMAEFHNDGRELSAVRFHPSDTLPVEYYDREGEALRGQFLLAPLDLARVTSGFNLRRFHPILRRRRPHRGVDYGAPRGTPVRVTGDGVVTRAGPWGGYGNAIEVRHTNGMRTRYAHLSRIESGVRAGARVAQGEVIGRVGSTGLSTSNHLHYEFLKNGSQVNPARLNFPRAEPVEEQYRDQFFATRDAVQLLLNRVLIPTAEVAATTLAED